MKRHFAEWNYYGQKMQKLVKHKKLLEYQNNLFIIEQISSNKSSLLLKIILQNSQTLQLSTMIIKTESIYKRY
jgi:hypothetical protein